MKKLHAMGNVAVFREFFYLKLLKELPPEHQHILFKVKKIFKTIIYLEIFN